MKSGSFRRYLLIRTLLTIPMVLILLTLVFFLLRAAPGDPVTASLAGRVPPDQIAQRKEQMGLDDPVILQYLRYLGEVLTGDFGNPITDSRSVLGVIVETAPATIELAMFGMLVAIVIGVVFGGLAGRFRDTSFDITSRMFGIVMYATPLFWSALLAQLYFSVKLGWFPTASRVGAFNTPDQITGFFTLDAILTGDWEALSSTLEHLALPAITLGLLVGGIFLRMVRVNMMQSLRSDYVEAARARGVPERNVVFRHAFKNSLIPIVTIMGLQFALLLGNATLTENVFSWPGLARELVDFIGARDYAAVQGIVAFIALAIAGMSLLIDIINGLVDPRVRY